LVGAGKHDLLMKFLETPAAFDKIRGQVIQQWLVDRPLAHHAEVTGCSSDAVAKVQVPNAIHDHPGGERVLRVGQPVGQRSTPSC